MNQDKPTIKPPTTSTEAPTTTQSEPVDDQLINLLRDTAGGEVTFANTGGLLNPTAQHIARVNDALRRAARAKLQLDEGDDYTFFVIDKYSDGAEGATVANLMTLYSAKELPSGYVKQIMKDANISETVDKKLYLIARTKVVEQVDRNMQKVHYGEPSEQLKGFATKYTNKHVKTEKVKIDMLD
jgi:hypothetical protein